MGTRRRPGPHRRRRERDPAGVPPLAGAGDRRRPVPVGQEPPALDGEGLPVLEYPQSPGRMTPATARFYEAVINQQLTHSGDSASPGTSTTPSCARTPEAPASSRNGETHPDESTPPSPLSWRMTGPPPWPVPSATASTSEGRGQTGRSPGSNVTGVFHGVLVQVLRILLELFEHPRWGECPHEALQEHVGPAIDAVEGPARRPILEAVKGSPEASGLASAGFAGRCAACKDDPPGAMGAVSMEGLSRA